MCKKYFHHNLNFLSGKRGHKSITGRISARSVRRFSLARGHRPRRDGLREFSQVSPEPPETRCLSSDTPEFHVREREAEAGAHQRTTRAAKAFPGSDERRALLAHATQHFGDVDAISGERECESQSEETRGGRFSTWGKQTERVAGVSHCYGFASGSEEPRFFVGGAEYSNFAFYGRADHTSQSDTSGEFTSFDCDLCRVIFKVMQKVILMKISVSIDPSTENPKTHPSTGETSERRKTKRAGEEN